VPKIYSKIASLLMLIIVSSCSKSSKPEIVIDPSITFQKIDGFGGFGAQKPWWQDPPFYDEKFIKLVIQDLGITILRDSIPPSFEGINDNDDPYSFDYSTNPLDSLHTAGGHTGVNEHLSYLKSMNAHGLNTLILSVWSPPIWMKYNKLRGNGLERGQNRAPPYVDNPTNNEPNQLIPKYYEEFAEFCVAYIRLIKEKTGIDVYAISLQNEPRFSQWYVSAVYSPEALAKLIAVVGDRFEREGIKTKIFAPEDVAHFNAMSAYLNAFYSNPDTLKHLDFIGIHAYKNDGVSASDSGPQYWMKMRDIAKSKDLKIWMTETSGQNGLSYDESFSYAKTIYSSLEFGQVSAWVFWEMSSGRETALIQDGKPTWLYHISKHFYKHVRPGAVKVSSKSNNSKLLTLSFLSPDKTYITTILINISRKNMNASSNIGTENSDCWQTSETLKYSTLNCNSGNPLMLPPRSITTWVSALKNPIEPDT